MSIKTLIPLPVALLLASCGHYVKNVDMAGSPSVVEPEDEACLDKDVSGFLSGNLAAIQACTEHLSCRKHSQMAVTLMVGCNGTRGGLYVLSNKELKKFNQCIVDSGATWDYSGLCTTSECECAWTLQVDITCQKK